MNPFVNDIYIARHPTWPMRKLVIGRPQSSFAEQTLFNLTREDYFSAPRDNVWVRNSSILCKLRIHLDFEYAKEN